MGKQWVESNPREEDIKEYIDPTQTGEKNAGLSATSKHARLGLAAALMATSTMASAYGFDDEELDAFMAEHNALIGKKPQTKTNVVTVDPVTKVPTMKVVKKHTPLTERGKKRFPIQTGKIKTRHSVPDIEPAIEIPELSQDEQDEAEFFASMGMSTGVTSPEKEKTTLSAQAGVIHNSGMYVAGQIAHNTDKDTYIGGEVGYQGEKLNVHARAGRTHHDEGNTKGLRKHTDSLGAGVGYQINDQWSTFAEATHIPGGQFTKASNKVVAGVTYTLPTEKTDPNAPTVWTSSTGEKLSDAEVQKLGTVSDVSLNTRGAVTATVGTKNTPRNAYHSTIGSTMDDARKQAVAERKGHIDYQVGKINKDVQKLEQLNTEIDAFNEKVSDSNNLITLSLGELAQLRAEYSDLKNRSDALAGKVQSDISELDDLRFERYDDILDNASRQHAGLKTSALPEKLSIDVQGFYNEAANLEKKQGKAWNTYADDVNRLLDQYGVRHAPISQADLSRVNHAGVDELAGKHSQYEVDYANTDTAKKVTDRGLKTNAGVLAAAQGAADTERKDRYRDSDEDGVRDRYDAFPHNPDESVDADGDGVGANADYDDNNVNVTEKPQQPQELQEPENPEEHETPVDTDGDKIGDEDPNPNEVGTSTDEGTTDNTDGDGVGNNGDDLSNETTDTDGDGVGDDADAFPHNAGETVDTDGDGVGDNTDARPNDPNITECVIVDNGNGGQAEVCY